MLTRHHIIITQNLVHGGLKKSLQSALVIGPVEVVFLGPVFIFQVDGNLPWLIGF